MDLQNLTRKNQEFITIATHQLQADGKSQEEIDSIISDAVEVIRQHQKEGLTARQIYGAPTTWAKTFTADETKANPNEKDLERNTNPWLMWLDSSLLILGFFGLFYGLIDFSGSKTTYSYGLITTLIIAASGGAAFYGLYHFVYRFNGYPKSERPSIWKALLYMVVLMALWIAVVGISSLIPAAINPTLPPLGMIALGAIAFAIKYYFKKRYNIQSSLQTQPVNTK